MSTCSLPECDLPRRGPTYCNRHRKRFARYGDPRASAPPRPSHWGTAEERFWRNVEKSDSCWLWTGSGGGHGYGQFTGSKPGELVHRWSYEHHIGPIPPGLQVDHKCRVRRCVNPEHLQVVTGSENRQNLSGAYRNSLSGIRGVRWTGHSWGIRVRVDGRKYHRDGFATAEDAERAAIALRSRVMTNNLADHERVAEVTR